VGRLTEQFWRDSANKYCRRCAARGVLEPATQVDHVVPFEGREDPRRLDRRNLQPLCGTCNRQKALEHRRQRAYDVVWSGEQDARGSAHRWSTARSPAVDVDREHHRRARRRGMIEFRPYAIAHDQAGAGLRAYLPIATDARSPTAGRAGQAGS
jgi:hypothetical protein